MIRLFWLVVSFFFLAFACWLPCSWMDVATSLMPGIRDLLPTPPLELMALPIGSVRLTIPLADVRFVSFGFALLVAVHCRSL